jgi:hypothetical protein
VYGGRLYDDIMEALNRLDKLEDKLKNGQLAEYKYKVGDVVWSYFWEHNKYGFYLGTTVQQFKVHQLFYHSTTRSPGTSYIITQLEGKKDSFQRAEYEMFDTKEEAEAYLEELQRR